MKRFVCKVCGYAYDPEVGDSEHGIAPGTALTFLTIGFALYAGQAKKNSRKKKIKGNSLSEIQFAAFRLRDAAFFMLRPL